MNRGTQRYVIAFMALLAMSGAVLAVIASVHSGH